MIRAQFLLIHQPIVRVWDLTVRFKEMFLHKGIGYWALEYGTRQDAKPQQSRQVDLEQDRGDAKS